jgi:hypothetical protein
MISALAVVLAAPALAGEEMVAPRSEPLAQSLPQQQKPVIDMDRLLRELRELDSSQDMQGDHVVGEEIC